MEDLAGRRLRDRRSRARRQSRGRGSLFALRMRPPTCEVRLVRAGDLLDARSVGVHRVDLVLARAIRGERDLPAVGRPRVEAVVGSIAAACERFYEPAVTTTVTTKRRVAQVEHFGRPTERIVALPILCASIVHWR